MELPLGRSCAPMAPSQTTLPPIVFDLIAQHLTHGDLAAARSACKLFTAAIDSSIKSIRVEQWQDTHSDLAGRLQHVTCLHAVINSPADWRNMQQLARQLPLLTTATFKGRRTWHKMTGTTNTTNFVTPSPVSSLQAASFQGTVKGLADIAALAPQLQQLYCERLSLIESLDIQLPQCTHFGASLVHVNADGPQEAAHAFAAAFPVLQVLFQAPEFGYNQPNSRCIFLEKVPLRDVLAKCNMVHSVRVFGCTTAMYGMLPEQLVGLQHVHRLSVYGIGPAAELKGIDKLTQLQHIRLSVELPAKRAAGQLLQELAQLPQLQHLALPAKLLCSRCCPGMQQGLYALAGKSSVSKLVFLERPACSQRRQAGDYCPHRDNMHNSMQAVLAPAAAAAAAAAAGGTSGQQQQRQQQKEVLLLHQQQQQHDEVRPPTSSAGQLDRDSCCDGSSSSVWGTFGPVGEW